MYTLCDMYREYELCGMWHMFLTPRFVIRFAIISACWPCLDRTVVYFLILLKDWEFDARNRKSWRMKFLFALLIILQQGLFYFCQCSIQFTMRKILILIEEKHFFVHLLKLHQSHRIYSGSENCVHGGIHNCLHLNLSGVLFSLKLKIMSCLVSTQTHMTNIWWQCHSKTYPTNDDTTKNYANKNYVKWK